MDLDTVLSKIDSRLLSDVIAIKGPYAARYGPGLSHLDVDLLDSPRYDDGFHAQGLTGTDYKTNGEGWSGRQMLWGGASDWGFRAAYGHRTGNDYTSGGGIGVPSSYNSRDVNVALGRDFCNDRSIEFHYLRMDQTGVELPGQAFDIDVLCTDGYDVMYSIADQPWYDRMDLDVWYNRTRFDGSAQRAGKRRQFPYYDDILFVGFTDVDSMSTGFRSAVTWEGVEDERLTAGADLRFVKQELNEISSGQIGLHIWDDANSPIPKSYQANPGLFLEYVAPLGERWTVNAGARGDLVCADVIDDPAKLASLGTQSTPAQPISLADILGSDEFAQTFGLWAAYVTGEYEIDCCWTAEFAAGYAQRPPSLTELYAAESFMFVLQNGLNILTGDPRLNPEQLCQIDVGLRLDTDRFRGRIGGYHGWAWDYITFENTGIQRGPSGEIEQVRLKYVNTDLATFLGAELYGECDWNDWLTPFATVSYIEGRDRTRNGDFATWSSGPGRPSSRWPGLPRGAFSGVSGSEEEPLPGISPLESRLGFRLHQPVQSPRWSAELSARLVDRQDRVASSLLETPTPGFTVWDLRSYWRATDRLLLIAGVENFTDRNYREHLDFRSPSGIQMFQPGISSYFGGELTY
jgi:outer membrane receptor protein involved in Fe transport